MAKRRGGPGGDFPLDNNLDALAQVVADLQKAMVPLVKAANDAAAALKNTRAAAQRPGNGGSVTPQGGAVPSQATQAAAQTAANTQAIRDVIKFRDVMQSVSDLKQGLEGGRDLARAMGLQDAARQLDGVAKGLDIADKAVKGVTGSVKLLGAAWRPVLVGVGSVVAGLVGLQRLFELTTGTSLTLKETVQVMGLSLAKALADAYVQVTRLRLAFASSEQTPELVKDLEDARATAGGLEGTIRDIQAAAAGRGDPPPFKSWADELERVKGQVKQLATDIDDSLGSVFGGLGSETRKPPEIPVPTIEPTAFQMFQQDLGRMADLTQGTFDFIAGGVQALSGTIASVLVDAFINPQQDIRETFGQLFRFLAQQILQILIQAAIARAILGGVGAAGAGGAVPVAAADGGQIKAGNHLASLAHFGRGARGYAVGGVTIGRPAGIPASDTVPAWLTPGEFVEPLRAVRHYGVQVMEGLRSLSIPREPLLALASGVQVPQRVATPMPRGYAAGGAVATAGGASSAPAGPVPAVVVANEATFDRLLAGGQGSMMRFMRENRSAIKSVLG